MPAKGYTELHKLQAEVDGTKTIMQDVSKPNYQMHARGLALLVHDTLAGAACAPSWA